MSRDWFAGVLAARALCLAPLAATPATPGADGATPASDVVSAARGYRASLDHLLPFREHAVTRARETAFARRQLLADGLASRREAEIAEPRLAEAEADVAAGAGRVVPGVPRRHHRRGNRRPRAHRRAVAPTRRAGRLANGRLAIDWGAGRRTRRAPARRSEDRHDQAAGQRSRRLILSFAKT